MAEAQLTGDSSSSSSSCSACLDPLENLRSLPCGHSLCGPPNSCLSKVFESETPLCPECRCDLRVNGAKSPSDFPVNIALKRALEKLREASSAVKIYEVCLLHELAKIFYCRKCGETVCEKCWDNKHVMDDDHSVISFEKYKEEVQEQLLQSKLRIDETKLDKITQGHKEITSKFIQGGQVLNQLRFLLNKRSDCGREVVNSRSSIEVSQTTSNFNSINVEIEHLIRQFESGNTVVIKNLHHLLSEWRSNGANVKKRRRMLVDSQQSASGALAKPITTEHSSRKIEVKVISKIQARVEFLCENKHFAVDSDSSVFIVDLFMTLIKLTSPLDAKKIHLTETKLSESKLTGTFALNDVFYGISFSPPKFTGSHSQSHFVVLNEKFEIVRTLDTSGNSDDNQYTWQLGGNGSTLVFWNVKNHQLRVYENEKFSKCILLRGLEDKSSDITSNRIESTDQYLILLAKTFKEDDGSESFYHITLDWNQIKAKELNEIHWLWWLGCSGEYDIFEIFLQFFVLGAKTHAFKFEKRFTGSRYFPQHERLKIILYRDVVKKITRGRSEEECTSNLWTLDFSHREEHHLSNEVMIRPQLEEFDVKVLGRVKNNVMLCNSSLPHDNTSFLFVMQIDE